MNTLIAILLVIGIGLSSYAGYSYLRKEPTTQEQVVKNTKNGRVTVIPKVHSGPLKSRRKQQATYVRRTKAIQRKDSRLHTRRNPVLRMEIPSRTQESRGGN